MKGGTSKLLLPLLASFTMVRWQNVIGRESARMEVGQKIDIITWLGKIYLMYKIISVHHKERKIET